MRCVESSPAERRRGAAKERGGAEVRRRLRSWGGRPALARLPAPLFSLSSCFCSGRLLPPRLRKCDEQQWWRPPRDPWRASRVGQPPSRHPDGIRPQMQLSKAAALEERRERQRAGTAAAPSLHADQRAAEQRSPFLSPLTLRGDGKNPPAAFPQKLLAASPGKPAACSAAACSTTHTGANASIAVPHFLGSFAACRTLKHSCAALKLRFEVRPLLWLQVQYNATGFLHLQDGSPALLDICEQRAASLRLGDVVAICV